MRFTQKKSVPSGQSGHELTNHVRCTTLQRRASVLHTINFHTTTSAVFGKTIVVFMLRVRILAVWKVRIVADGGGSRILPVGGIRS